jgi:hypothetical protein
MTEKNNALDQMSNQLSENILAVKGTLELVDTSVTEDELHKLLVKSIERMDIIQTLSNDALAALKECLIKKGEIKE